MKTRILFPAIKGTCFLFLLGVLLLAASWLFMPKNNHKSFGFTDEEMLAGGVLGERDNSIDVLVVGDSEAYSSISPMQLWEQHGFTSYLCSTSAQPLYDSYRYLRQAFERQSPRVVILETNAIFRTYKLNDYLLSRAKVLFSVLRYHDRWKTLSVNDFGGEARYTWTDDLKGFRYNTKVVPADTRKYMLPTDAEQEIPLLNRACLAEMMALCEENGAQLILVSTPSTLNWNYARHNSIAAFAAEHGLTYLDMNTMPDEVPVNWETDTRDKGDHLNYSGAVKVTRYLGQYLTQRFELPDKRGAADFSSWNDALQHYRNTIAAG